MEHAFSHVCREHDIDQRLTKVNHPWTNGQVERPPLGRFGFAKSPAGQRDDQGEAQAELDGRD